MTFTLLEKLPLGRIAPASRLGLAYLQGEPAAQSFYQAPPDGFVQAAASAGRHVRRAALADALAAFNAAHGAHPAALAGIETLRRPGSVAVVAGQQVAPLGGPLYTLFKAAGAVSLATRLRRDHGIEAVPVFWAEGDDHDLLEVERVLVAPETAGWREFRWPSMLGDAGRPIGDLVPADSWQAARAVLAESLAALPHVDGAMALVPIEGGFTLGDWFSTLILALFSRHGLVVAYGRDPALRALWADLVPAALAHDGEVVARIEECGRRIRAAGWKPQLHKGADSVPFFFIEAGRRLTIARNGGAYDLAGRRLSRAELGKLLADQPASFSPGVSVRPIFQDHILPTVAYVGGLSEAAYLGQLAEVYRLFDESMPVIAPRFSATFVEPAAARLLIRHGIAPSALLGRSPEMVLAAMTSTGRSPASAKTWEALREKSLAPLRTFQETLPENLAPSKGYLDGVAGRIAHLLSEAEEKVGRAVRAREEETLRQLTRTTGLLFPNGGLMERAVSCIRYYATWGPPFIDRLLRDLPEDLLAHYFVEPRGEEEEK